MIDLTELAAIPVIVSIVYGGIALLKKAVDNNEKVVRFIPIIAACFGAIIGITAFFLMPELVPTDNAFMALLVGGASGLASTGTNQIVKQLSKAKIKEESKKETNKVEYRKEESSKKEYRREENEKEGNLTETDY